jgi:hypothetical protein
LIIVRHIKSISDLSLPLSLYGPIRSTHRYSQGVVITCFVGIFPYFYFLGLLTWQVLQVFVWDLIRFLMPFQYITALNASSRRVCPGCCK